MKKLIPFLIIGILILSGIGASAPAEKEIIPQQLQPPDLIIGIRGTWFGIEFTILNDGEDFPGETINVTVTVDAPIVLINQVTATPVPLPDPGMTITDRTGIILGLGSTTVTVEVEYEGEIVASQETTGFLFFVLVSFEPIPIP